MRRLRRIVINSAAFLTLALLMLIGIFRVLWMWDDTYTVQSYRQFYALPRDTADVVIMGSSGMKEFFISVQAYHDYGITTVNLAASGQMFRANKYLVREAEKTQDPKLYIIDTRQLQYEDESNTEKSFRLTADSMKPSLNWLKMVKALHADYVNCNPQIKSDIKDYLWSFGIYHHRWKDLRDSDFYGYPDMWEGYLIDTVCEPFDHIPPVQDVEPEPMTAYAEETLREFLDFCKTQDARFLFVNVPYYMEEKHAARNAYIGNLIQEEGFDYLDLNDVAEEMGFEPQMDFRDWAHVNSYGAIKYTDYLAQYIQNRYELPDHRGEKDTAHYEEEYQEFADRLLEVTVDFDQYLQLLYHYPDYKITVAYNTNILDNTLDDLEKARLTTLLDTGTITRVVDTAEGERTFLPRAVCIHVQNAAGESIDHVEYSIDPTTKKPVLTHYGEVVDYVNIK